MSSQAPLEATSSRPQQPKGDPDRLHGRRETVALDDIPGEVLTINDLAAVLGIGRRTITRKLAAGAFPIPSLAGLTHGTKQHRRWSKHVVRAYLRMELPGLRTVSRRHGRSVA